MQEFILSRAVIEVSGDDHISFLHRMCTQNIEVLGDNDKFYAAFTSPKGRLVDVVYGFRENKKTFLVSSHREASHLIEWLDTYIIIDEVELNDRSERLRLKVKAREGKIDFVELSEAQAKGESEYERFRIQSGIVSAPEEINDKYGPLELGLHDALHWSKGCYIGQEVISRIDNYQKQTKHLLAFAANKGVVPGDEIYLDDKKIGVLTSTLDAFENDEQVNALGVVRAELKSLPAVLLAGDKRVALKVLERSAAQVAKD